MTSEDKLKIKTLLLSIAILITTSFYWLLLVIVGLWYFFDLPIYRLGAPVQWSAAKIVAMVVWIGVCNKLQGMFDRYLGKQLLIATAEEYIIIKTQEGEDAE